MYIYIGPSASEATALWRYRSFIIIIIIIIIIIRKPKGGLAPVVRIYQYGGFLGIVDIPSILNQISTSAARSSTAGRTPHCRVLPPGEFNGVIQ